MIQKEEKRMERTIRVTGRGRISVKPDVMQLNIRLEETFKDYEKAVAASAEKTETLRNALLGAGFDPKDLKTTSFNISAEYESYCDSKNNWRNRFVGYKFHHALYIKFANDNKLLGKAIYAVTKSGVNSEISVNYTVSDPEPAREELLKNAVKDSRVKATALAESAGVALGEILSMDYSWGQINIYSRPIENITYGAAKMAMADECYSFDIEPEDIDLEDTVTIVWEIK